MMKDAKHPAGPLLNESPEGKDCNFFISGLTFDLCDRNERKKDFAALSSGDGVGDGRRTAEDGASLLVVVRAASQQKEKCDP